MNSTCTSIQCDLGHTPGRLTSPVNATNRRTVRPKGQVVLCNQLRTCHTMHRDLQPLSLDGANIWEWQSCDSLVDLKLVMRNAGSRPQVHTRLQRSLHVARRDLACFCYVQYKHSTAEVKWKCSGDEVLHPRTPLVNNRYCTFASVHATQHIASTPGNVVSERRRPL